MTTIDDHVRWSERDLQRNIEREAMKFGWELTYHTYDSRRSKEGFPDLVMVRPPRVIFAELKSDDKQAKLSDPQKEWAEALLQCPVEYYLWRPENLEAIMQALM